MKSLFAALVALLALAAAARAGDAPALLTISAEGVDPVELTAADLASYEQRVLRATTEFTDSTAVFSGPLVRDVLAPLIAVSPGATEVRLRALNDYVATVPLDDFRRYDVILATSMDGKPMSRRDKGPIWLMYPVDEHVELQDPVYINRLVWQLADVSLR
ncbi:molybdopterin-dependent oxidoreductase [Rubrimonas cliftonensis]|uniref:Oxidoreductase molybdopterin-binding domain-containing protein n=1 Tax=Rubrimonas cliftonensis TaxID=89524 RepID=A0A1H3Z2H2_9RHOB|nr:molybdopterin-dependent oxidoreductase [Rubrimonas cliftonensis]SEA17959.1 hypothetical protein SAMN05444370_103361 [Rubrimonas cliftonensis]